MKFDKSPYYSSILFAFLTVAIMIVVCIVKVVKNENDKPVIKASAIEAQNLALESDIEFSPILDVYETQNSPWSHLWGTDGISDADRYYLAKLAAAEAIITNTETKVLLIMSVLNRVDSPLFPDTVKDVIFQNDGTLYQYSVIKPGGWWWVIEPDEDCYKAVDIALNAQYDWSLGSLYFEALTNPDNWFSRNLEFTIQSENVRFYK